MCDKDGTSISDGEGQRVEHFKEMLNRPIPLDPPDIQPADSDLPIDCSVPTKEEICNAIKQPAKSAGPDSIPAEAMKAGIGKSIELLCPLFSKIWEEEQVPTEWEEGLCHQAPERKKAVTGPASTTEVELCLPWQHR